MIHFGVIYELKMDPKLDPKWAQFWPKCPTPFRVNLSPFGPKLGPEWPFGHFGPTHVQFGCTCAVHCTVYCTLHMCSAHVLHSVHCVCTLHMCTVQCTCAVHCTVHAQCTLCTVCSIHCAEKTTFNRPPHRSAVRRHRAFGTVFVRRWRPGLPVPWVVLS